MSRPTEEAIEQWHPVKLGARGRPQVYGDHAIETAIFIRQVFHLALRQTEGFMNSLARLMKAQISVPDFSSISKRSIELPRHVLSKALDPGSLKTDRPATMVYRGTRILWFEGFEQSTQVKDLVGRN